MEKTVLCPVHKKEQLTFEKSDVRPHAYVAICKCDPGDKKWFGKPVVMKIDPSGGKGDFQRAELVIESEPATTEEHDELTSKMNFPRRKRR